MMKCKRIILQLFSLAMIAVMLLMPTSCIKNNTDNTPHHNTTYVWGKYNVADVMPGDKITKSVDSTSVDIVFLESDGVSWEGTSTTIAWRYIEKILDGVKSPNKHKIRGKGTLHDVGITRSIDSDYQDSNALANFGFEFGHIYYRK